MSIRFTFGGDEHIFAEVSEEMSLEAFFKGMSVTNALHEARIRGVTEICPANASFQVRFDPDVIAAGRRACVGMSRCSRATERRCWTTTTDRPVSGRA